MSQSNGNHDDDVNGNVPLKLDDDIPVHSRKGNEEAPALIQKDDVDSESYSGRPPRRATKSLLTWPYAIWFIMSSEFCERFSFYGLKTILPPFLKDYIKFPEETATLIIHSFIFGACGVISDMWLGKFKTIIVMSVVYIGGSAMLSASGVQQLFHLVKPLSLTALFLIGLGTGGIKPNISSFVGDQFHPSSTEALTSVFAIFYFLINAGSLCSTILTPILRARVNYAVAFGVPAILLFLATVLFIVGGPGYTRYKVAKGPSVFTLFFRVIKTAYQERKRATNSASGSNSSRRVNVDTTDAENALSTDQSDQTLKVSGNGAVARKINFLDYAKPVMGDQVVEDVRSVLKVLYVFLPLPVFWSLYDQHSSKWVFMAEEMNTTVGNTTLLPEQIQVLNPLLTLSMIPIFDRLLYPFVSKFILKGKIHPLKHKMVTGMILTAVSFVVSGIIQYYMYYKSPAKVSVFLMIPQFWILSCAECLVSITGLEFAYSQAPKWLKSIVMSGWLLTTALGNAIVSILALINIDNRALEFFLYAALMILFTQIFYIMVRDYELVKTSDASDSDSADNPAPNNGESSASTESSKITDPLIPKEF